jgi:hypothetical protein
VQLEEAALDDGVLVPRNLAAPPLDVSAAASSPPAAAHFRGPGLSLTKQKNYCVSAARTGDGVRPLVALQDWTQRARVPRGSPAAPAAARTRLRFSALVRLGAAPARDLFLGSALGYINIVTKFEL